MNHKDYFRQVYPQTTTSCFKFINFFNFLLTFLNDSEKVKICFALLRKVFNFFKLT